MLSSMSAQETQQKEILPFVGGNDAVSFSFQIVIVTFIILLISPEVVAAWKGNIVVSFFIVLHNVKFQKPQGCQCQYFFIIMNVRSSSDSLPFLFVSVFDSVA